MDPFGVEWKKHSPTKRNGPIWGPMKKHSPSKGHNGQLMHSHSVAGRGDSVQWASNAVQPCCEFTTLAKRKKLEAAHPAFASSEAHSALPKNRFKVWWKYTQLSIAAARPTRADGLRFNLRVKREREKEHSSSNAVAGGKKATSSSSIAARTVAMASLTSAAASRFRVFIYLFIYFRV